MYSLLARSRSLMDKISVCGTGAPGSTPGESTKWRHPKGCFHIEHEPVVGFMKETRSKSRKGCQLYVTSTQKQF